MADIVNSGETKQPVDDIPVEDLIRMTREFTRRITNQDRQRLARDLRDSGHQRTIQITAPITLQQFFAGEIDLDTELASRFVNAPLLAHARFTGQPNERRPACGIFSSQDDSNVMTIDAYADYEDHAAVEITFTLFSSLAMRFRLPALSTVDRRRWLELMRRESGIAFLWTRSRWEQSYLIFVVREHFARLYAFSPQGIEAAARLTPDMVASMVNWMEGVWFPGTPIEAVEEPRGRLFDTPLSAAASTQIERPRSLRPEEITPSDAPEPEAGVEESDLPAGDLEW